MMLTGYMEKSLRELLVLTPSVVTFTIKGRIRGKEVIMNLKIILMVVAIICFVLAGFGVNLFPTVSIGWIGLAFMGGSLIS
jgi:hypothetical protein